MGDRSSIEWTDATWNPLIGCSRVSAGCEHCYAERFASRFSDEGYRYHGIARRSPAGPRWTGKVRLVEELLDKPLRWKRPRRIFVNSMSDLFHENVPDLWIDRVFAVMALAPHHTFLVLTKRPEQMQGYLRTAERASMIWNVADRVACNLNLSENHPGAAYLRDGARAASLPLPNVHLGVSIENRDALARADVLRAIPAALRFLSIEPLLSSLGDLDLSGIGWVIVGGESGPGARPFDLAWARSAIMQCTAANVPCFVKQIGAEPFDSAGAHEPGADALCPHHHQDGVLPLNEIDGSTERQVWWCTCCGRLSGLRDRKGGDVREWPENLRVRQYPA